jgi:hypothetical protein
MFLIAIAFILTAVVAMAAEVTVHIHNEAKVAGAALRDALDVAKRAFREARVPARWVTCPGESCSASGELIYELVIANSRAEAASSSTFAMGYSLIVAGQAPVYAKVLLPRVMQYAEFADVRVSTVLGYSIAHEVAHLILRSNSHGNFGIMKARWSRSDARLLGDNRLKFHSAEVQRMRQALGF